jgi:PTH1 family peptidyl-tRNA hydrolase
LDSFAIVVGLGNPGERYRDTRHNVGFWVLDRLADRSGAAFRAEGELRRYAWFAETRLAETDVVLAKPRTYMNRSGRAVSGLCRAYSLGPEQLLIVHDDADLEIGRLRIRKGGGAGGHNGVRSLLEVLGNGEFTRIRIGVRGPERHEEELADYVLSDFSEEDRRIAEEACDVAADAVEYLLEDGVTAAMNRYNGMRIAESSSADSSEG